MTVHQRPAADAVETFRPWESDSLKVIRRRLLRARDLSTVRAMATPSEAARSMFWMANELAGAWAFAAMPEIRLLDARRAILMLFLAGAAIEMAEAADGE